MDEKEVLHGYVIDSHIWVGHKRICFGIAEDQTIEFPYMTCVYESEGYMYPVCDRLHSSALWHRPRVRVLVPTSSGAFKRE